MFTWRSNDSDLFHVTEALNESVKFCLASGFLLAVASFMLNTYHINCLATRYGSRTRSYPLIDTLLCTSTLNVFIRDSVIQFVCNFLDLIRCTIPDTKSNSRVHKNAVFSKAMRFTAMYSLWRRIQSFACTFHRTLSWWLWTVMSTAGNRMSIACLMRGVVSRMPKSCTMSRAKIPVFK